MTGGWHTDLDPTLADPAAAPAGRGPEHRVAAFAVATILVLGALMGGINLFVDGVLRDGPGRWVYAATMGLLIAMAVSLAIRRRTGRWHMFALVLLGDLIYVVVVLCVQDPVRYAPPLMLLFPVFVAAWFLGPWELGVNMVATVVACLVGLWPSYDSAVGLGVQVGVSAGTLNTAALGVFVMRRRVQRLLTSTRTLSRLDPLTGLYNRRFLEEQAPRLWRQARRDGTRVAALVLDLDHFKQLNDAHGHAAGDAVLRTVAGALGAAVRPSDILARTGGEELVVLGLVSDGDEAAHLAERLRFAVAGSRTPGGHAVTASIGVALNRPADDEDATHELWRVVDRADAAMYEAKQQGRNRVFAVGVPRARPGLPDRLRCGPPATSPSPASR